MHRRRRRRRRFDEEEESCHARWRVDTKSEPPLWSGGYNTENRIQNIIQHKKKLLLSTGQDKRLLAASLCSPPAARTACLSTSLDHSSLGRPTVRTKPSVAAQKDPGRNAADLRTLSAGSRATFPNSISWFRNRDVDIGRWEVVLRTSLFEILDTYAGRMPQSARRHLLWNPSKRRRSAALSHALASP